MPTWNKPTKKDVENVQVSRALRGIEWVMATIGHSHSYIYKEVAEGRFPAPVKPNDHKKSVRWVESEVHAWLDKVIAERDAVLAKNPKTGAAWLHKHERRKRGRPKKQPRASEANREAADPAPPAE